MLQSDTNNHTQVDQECCLGTRVLPATQESPGGACVEVRGSPTFSSSLATYLAILDLHLAAGCHVLPVEWLHAAVTAHNIRGVEIYCSYSP